MPVPDDVVFGPGITGGAITYGVARGMDDDGKISALKLRLDTFVVSHIDELGKPEGGVAKVYSPFPLALLTCVGIETLGQVMYYAASEEGQREGFLKIAKALHPHFSRALKKKEKEDVALMFPEKAATKIETPAHMLYFYQRNTMIHGFQSRGVYLTEDRAQWCIKNGGMLVNPYWLWREFKRVYEDMFAKLAANSEPTNALRRSALQYVTKMLT